MWQNVDNIFNHQFIIESALHGHLLNGGISWSINTCTCYVVYAACTSSVT